MVSWIKDFSDTYHSATKRYPGIDFDHFVLFLPLRYYAVIYTSTSWWTTCTGNSAAFAGSSPLWVARCASQFLRPRALLIFCRYASSVGALPAGWTYHTFWQYADSGSNPGDQDVFNGDAAGLKRCDSMMNSDIFC